MLYFAIEAYGSLSVSLFWQFVNSQVGVKAAKVQYGIVVAGGQVGYPNPHPHPNPNPNPNPSPSPNQAEALQGGRLDASAYAALRDAAAAAGELELSRRMQRQRRSVGAEVRV